MKLQHMKCFIIENKSDRINLKAIEDVETFVY